MSLAALFAANNDLVLDRLGKGVTANSVYLVDPATGTQTEITDFAFEADAANQIVISQQGDEDSLTGQIEISTTYIVTQKHTFLIDEAVWQFNGRGGIDPNKQTILLKRPKLQSIRESRARRS